MDAQEALLKLGALLSGLGFHWSEPKTDRAHAQYKFCRKPDKHQWLTAVVWTAVTPAGPLPDKRTPIQVLLFGNTLPNRHVWIFSATKRFRKNKQRFAKRLRTRVALAAALSDSVHMCPRHQGPLPLRVVQGQLAWTCLAPACTHRGFIPETLSRKIQRHTPAGFWYSHVL